MKYPKMREPFKTDPFFCFVVALTVGAPVLGYFLIMWAVK